MRNFNTNQTRHFYVKGVTVGDVTTTADLGILENSLDQVTYVFVHGKNADGLEYRSDIIPAKNIVSLKQTTAAALATPLLKHTITINTNEFANAAALAGYTVKLAVTVHQLFDYDDANSVVIPVMHTVAKSETNTNFYAAFKDALEKALPKADKKYPYFTITADANGLYLTEAPQKYVRGKLTGEPVKFSVAFNLASTSYTDDVNRVWGTDTVTAPGGFISGNYALADLEYFAYGERGDVYRGSNWPNDVEPTYAINPKGAALGTLDIEYFYAGDAEDVQKSPRGITIAGADADITEMYELLKGIVTNAEPQVAG